LRTHNQDDLASHFTCYKEKQRNVSYLLRFAVDYSLSCTI